MSSNSLDAQANKLFAKSNKFNRTFQFASDLKPKTFKGKEAAASPLHPTLVTKEDEA